MARKDIEAGRAFVSLSVKDGAFSKGLRGASDKLKTFAAGVIAVGGVATLARRAFNALSAPLKHFTNFGDQLDKMSSRTGVSASALAELGFAAEQTGAGIEVLEKGFAGLSRTYAEARRGSVAATGALRDIGLTLKDIEGLSPDKQFELIANGLTQVSNESIRGAAAQQIFGRAGRQLLPLLRGAKGGIEALRQEARDLGIVPDDQAVKAAARLNDAFNRIGRVAKGVFFEIGAAIAPLLENGIARIVPVVRNVTLFIKDNWKSVADVVLPIMSSLAVVIETAWSAIWSITQSVWGGIRDLIVSVWGNVADNTGSTLSWFQETVIGAFSAVAFAIKEWRLLLKIGVTSALLSIVSFAAEVKHTFVERIPAYLKWFGENWRDVLDTALSALGAFAQNVFTNLVNLGDAIYGFFMGDGFNFTWTPLLEGFENTIKQFPEVAERVMGPLETQLRDELQGLAGELGQAWSAHSGEFAARAREVEAAMRNVTAAQDALAGNTLDALDFDADMARQKVVGSFSAAALAAQGQGGGPVAKTLKELLAETKRQYEAEMSDRRAAWKAMREGATLA